MPNAFQLEELDGPVALLTFDLPDKKVNTLGQAVLGELGDIAGQLAQRSDLKGLLLRSGKPGNFIAGADLNELAALAWLPAEQIEHGLAGGHKLFEAISRLPFPTVALIDGNCMGGGTELVLAMDERIASESPKTNIALPEIRVGLIPGWGGTQRLPRLIGVYNAIQMITSGEGVDAKRARELGLVFDAVPAEKLVEEGRRLINHLQQSGEWKTARENRSQPVGLSENEMFFMFATAEGYIKGKTKGQYPAPLVALKAIRQGCNLPLEEGLKVEREAAKEVVGSTISANLISIFFMQQRLDRDPGVADPAVKPRDVHRVGVLGAGLMGAGIAAAHARRGIPAAIVDIDDERLADGLKRCEKVVADRVKIGRATPEDAAKMFSLLSTSISHRIFGDCDVVIEAVTENEDLKKKIYGELAAALRDDAIFASNTSTISITRLAEAAPNAERFAGMHFFNPVDRMRLVEVIRGEKTGDETVATLVALARRIGKTPIVVNDCAGFLVNRVLFPYMNEALLLLLEGAAMDDIDKAAERFGMPMGPIALHDLVGVDTAAFAGRVMHEAYRDRSPDIPLMKDLVEAGRFGKKSGAGFRRFTGRKGKPEPDPELEPLLEKHKSPGARPAADFTSEVLTDRMFLPMLLEATRVLEENIVREPSDVDMGVILGIGFPPFRGGVLRWCDTEGAGEMLKRVEKYRQLGRRFEPTETLKRQAESGGKFYPREQAGVV